MPDYLYSSRRVSRQALRPLEITVWVGLATMVGFLVLSTFYPAVRELVERDRRIFPFALVVMYVLFLVPSRRLFRYQRYAQIGLSTTRKGFTYKDLQQEKILSWRDVTQARVIIDADPRQGTWVRRFIFKQAKGQVVLDNDPPTHELEVAGGLGPTPPAKGRPDAPDPGGEGWKNLLGEVEGRVKDVLYLFHWFHPLCPFCSGKLERGKVGCASCGRRVKFVPKILRPWEMLREEGIYLLLILLVAGPVFYPLLVAYLGVALLIPSLANRAGTLKPLTPTAPVEPVDEAPRPSRKKPGAVALLLALLLLGTSAWAAPAPSLDPGIADRAYFPLAVGNTWEYKSNLARVLLKVTGKEIVNGVSCFVLESFVDDSVQSSQKEYYTYTSDGLQVLKRVHKGSDFFLDTPEPMLTFPLAPGRRWTWQSTPQEGSVFFAFHVRQPIRIQVMDTSMVTLPVAVQGRAADGSEIQTKRWYARGIGMVREQTITKKAFQTFKLEASLLHYSVKEEPEGSGG